MKKHLQTDLGRRSYKWAACPVYPMCGETLSPTHQCLTAPSEINTLSWWVIITVNWHLSAPSWAHQAAFQQTFSLLANKGHKMCEKLCAYSHCSSVYIIASPRQYSNTSPSFRTPSTIHLLCRINRLLGDWSGHCTLKASKRAADTAALPAEAGVQRPASVKTEVGIGPRRLNRLLFALVRQVFKWWSRQ